MAYSAFATLLLLGILVIGHKVQREVRLTLEDGQCVRQPRGVEVQEDLTLLQADVRARRDRFTRQDLPHLGFPVEKLNSSQVVAIGIRRCVVHTVCVEWFHSLVQVRLPSTDGPCELFVGRYGFG
jgi:hypothetical protein